MNTSNILLGFYDQPDQLVYTYDLINGSGFSLHRVRIRITGCNLETDDTSNLERCV